MNLVWFSLLTILLIRPSTAVEKNPAGLVIALGDVIVQGLAHDVLALLEDALNGLDIGDMSGNTTGISYYLKDITLSNLDVGQAIVTSSAPSTIVFTINKIRTDVDCVITAEKVGSGQVSNGTETISLTDGTLTLSITEHVINRVLSFSGTVGTVFHTKYHFTGNDPGNLIPTVEKYINKTSSVKFPKIVSNILNEALKGLNSLLQLIPNPLVLDKKYALDWGFVGATTLNSKPGFNSLQSLGVVGSIDSQGNPNYTLPFKNYAGLPPTIPNTKDGIQILISNFTVNSLFYQLQYYNAIHFVITQQDIPSSIPIKLNTTDLKDIFRPLYKAYPNKDITIIVTTSHQMYFEDGKLPNEVTLAVPLSLGMNVVNATGGGEDTVAFVLSVKVNLGIQLFTHLVNTNGSTHWKVNGTLPMFGKLKAELVSTKIGPIDLLPFNILLGLGGDEIREKLKRFLSSGFSLPFDIGGLVNITDVSFNTFPHQQGIGVGVQLTQKQYLVSEWGGALSAAITRGFIRAH